MCLPQGFVRGFAEVRHREHASWFRGGRGGCRCHGGLFSKRRAIRTMNVRSGKRRVRCARPAPRRKFRQSPPSRMQRPARDRRARDGANHRGESSHENAEGAPMMQRTVRARSRPGDHRSQRRRFGWHSQPRRAWPRPRRRRPSIDGTCPTRRRRRAHRKSAARPRRRSSRSDRHRGHHPPPRGVRCRAPCAQQPDTLGLMGGQIGELGFRYRWATGDRWPEVP